MSYFPCDEGLYKKKYLSDDACGIISGMELVIDEVLPNAMDNLIDEIDNADEPIDDVLEIETSTGEDERILSEIREKVSPEVLKRFLHMVVESVTERAVADVEGERGQMLVAFIDDIYSDCSDDELAPYWEKSSKDEYAGHDPETDENFTYNINGKPRPVWHMENSWLQPKEETESQ